MTQIFLSTIICAQAFAFSNSELLSHLEAIHSKYPGVSQVFDAGRNDRGDTLYGIRISRTPESVDTAKIGYLVVGGHHGNEPHSITLAIHVARALAMQMSTVKFQSPSKDATEWWIVPAVNLPGAELGVRWENGRDPNREYPGPCEDPPAMPLKSVQAMMGILNQRPFAATATLHGYVGTLTAPWGITTPSPQSVDYPTYEKWLRAASRRNGYRWGTSSEMIYPANGTFEDYTYWKYGAWSLLVELKNGSPLDLAMTTDSILEFFSSVDRTRSIAPPTDIICKRGMMVDLFLE